MSALLTLLNEREDALAYLSDELGIRVRHYEQEDIYVLNYSQIDSPKTNEIVRECRGSIVRRDEHGHWDFLARTFKRFFNYGEAPETLDDFDFKRSVVMEKADGSLVKVWRDLNGDWQIGTRGTAYAESEHQCGEKFRDMIVEAFNYDSMGLFQSEMKHILSDDNETHLFEFTSPENRIVTPYENKMMVYLGSVDNITGYIKIFDYFDDMTGVRQAETFPIRSIEECVEAAAVLPDLKEGYIVRDMASGQMVKIKSPAYVAAHHMRGDYGLTPKNISRLVVTNETAEYLKYFPSDDKYIQMYVHHWCVIETFVRIVFEKNKHLDSMKEFAENVKHLPYSAVLFAAKRHEKDPVQVLHSQSEKYKMDLLLKWKEKCDGHANAV